MSRGNIAEDAASAALRLIAQGVESAGDASDPHEYLTAWRSMDRAIKAGQKNGVLGREIGRAVVAVVAAAVRHDRRERAAP